MKHRILLVAFLLLPLLAFSQGVTFEQGSWKDALALAKQSNKPVLLYIYFSDDFSNMEINRRIDESMNKYLFSLETVGDVCKTYFVCYRMDASKKEGLALAKKYGLDQRPTLLFVNADGRLLSTMQTVTLVDNFMEGTKNLLLDLKSSKPMASWEAEFPKKKQDQAFLLEYITKRIDMGLPFSEAFDAYLKLIPANGPLFKQAAGLFQPNASRLMVTDYAYQYFLANKTAYFEALSGEFYQAFEWTIKHTVGVATLLEDENLLKKAVDACQQIPMTLPDKKLPEEYYMDYYEQTNETDKSVAHRRLLVADILKMLDSEELLMKNNTNYQNLQKRLASEKDTVRIKTIARLIKEQPDLERSQLCSKLNGLAWHIFETSSNEAELKEALTWSEKTVQFKPTLSSYLDTNANILYKLGRKEEAIAMEKRAVANNTNTYSTSYSSINETLKKMEAGEKTW